MLLDLMTRLLSLRIRAMPPNVTTNLCGYAVFGGRACRKRGTFGRAVCQTSILRIRLGKASESATV